MSAQLPTPQDAPESQPEANQTHCSLAEAAAMIPSSRKPGEGSSIKHIQQLIDRGELRAQKLGSHRAAAVLVELASVHEHLARREQEHAAKTDPIAKLEAALAEGDERAAKLIEIDDQQRAARAEHERELAEYEASLNDRRLEARLAGEDDPIAPAPPPAPVDVSARLAAWFGGPRQPDRVEPFADRPENFIKSRLARVERGEAVLAPDGRSVLYPGKWFDHGNGERAQLVFAIELAKLDATHAQIEPKRTAATIAAAAALPALIEYLSSIGAAHAQREVALKVAQGLPSAQSLRGLPAEERRRRMAEHKSPTARVLPVASAPLDVAGYRITLTPISAPQPTAAPQAAPAPVSPDSEAETDPYRAATAEALKAGITVRDEVSR